MRFGHVGAIVHLGQLCEDAFERRLAHQFAKAVDGVVGHHFAAAQDQDSGADLLHHFEHMGAVEDDFAAVGERAQQSAQHQGGGDIQAGEGLVEDQDFGIVQQGGGEEDLLAHAFGVGREGRVAVVPEREERGGIRPSWVRGCGAACRAAGPRAGDTRGR